MVSWVTTTKEVRVESGARLHFALLDMTGDLGRIDGGLGVALSRPRIVLQASQAEQSTSNLFARHVNQVTKKLNDYYGLDKGLRVNFLESYAQHAGLGSTTQIILSVGAAYNALYGGSLNARGLATILGRGGTSGIGVAAFEKGGFILDGGHSFGPGQEKDRFLPSRQSRSPPGPVLFRAPLPRDWIFDVAVPATSRGLSGNTEAEFFAAHCPVEPHTTARIAHIVLSLVLPGVAQLNIGTFARGINALTTLGFKKSEIDAQTRDVKQLLFDLNKYSANNAAIGMSSFGPAVFCITHAMMSEEIRKEIRSTMLDYLDEVGGEHYVTHTRNCGAKVFPRSIQRAGKG